MVSSSAIVTTTARRGQHQPRSAQSTVRHERGQDEQQGPERTSRGRGPDGQVIGCPACHDRHRHQQHVGQREYRERRRQHEFVQPGAAAEPTEHQEAGQQRDQRRSHLECQILGLPRVGKVQLRNEREGHGNHGRRDRRHYNRGARIPHGTMTSGNDRRRCVVTGLGRPTGSEYAGRARSLAFPHDQPAAMARRRRTRTLTGCTTTPARSTICSSRERAVPGRRRSANATPTIFGTPAISCCMSLQVSQRHQPAAARRRPEAAATYLVPRLRSNRPGDPTDVVHVEST